MATQLTNYQCPACTGPLHFSPDTGKLVCDYCGSSYETAEIEKMYAAKEQAAQQATAQAAAKEAKQAAAGEPTDAGAEWGEDAKGMKVYNCPSCGAQLMCDATTAATSCPYCGNPTVVPGQFGGTLKPDCIIPFKMDKKAAIEALRTYYKGKKLLPRAFTAGNHIEEIQGVYVPFWLYDATANGDARYEATRTESFREGDYNVVRTHHFNVERSGAMRFVHVPVDGSSKMPDAHMDAVEPYNYTELKPFSTAYLPGFLADKYDVDAAASQKRADTRMQNTAVEALRGTVQGYTSVVPLAENVNVQHTATSYALMPVWMLHTKWNGQNFLFAMNGQTGRLIGDLPVDKGRLAAWFFGISVPLMVVLGLLMMLL